MISIDVDIEVDDKKLKALIKRLAFSEGAVEIGFFGEKKYTKGRNRGKDITVADVAAFNQTGTYARPFMFEVATSKKTKKALDEAARDIIVKGERRYATLKALGKTVQKEVEKKILLGPNRANKESTIKRKGSSTPLVETGTMSRSVKSRVVKKVKLK